MHRSVSMRTRGFNYYSTRAAVMAAKPVDRAGRISATTKAGPVHLTFTGELTVQDEPEDVTDDPPLFESEASCLDRHGLLSNTERESLFSDAFEPVVYIPD